MKDRISMKKKLGVKKQPKQQKLAKTITQRIALVLGVIFFIMLIILLRSTGSSLRAREKEKLNLLAKENATAVLEYLDKTIAKQQILTGVVNGLKNTQADLRENALAGMLTSFKAGEENILNVFYASEPNEFLENTSSGYSISAGTEGIDKSDNSYKFVTQELYQTVKEKKILVVADPFITNIDGKEYNAITILQPVYNNGGDVTGVVGSSIDTEILRNADFNSGGYTSFENRIICAHDMVITDYNDASAIGKNFTAISRSNDPQGLLDTARKQESVTKVDELKTGGEMYVASVSFELGQSTVPWLSITSIKKSELDRQVKNQMVPIVIVIIIGVLVLTIYCYQSIKIRLKPLENVVSIADSLSKGNLTTQKFKKSSNEIGEVTSLLEESMGVISGYVKDIDRAMALMASGNFEVYPEKPFIGEFKGIENSITNFIVNMCGTLTRINQSAQVVREGSEQVAQGSSSLSTGAEEQSESIRTLAEAVGLLREQVKENDEYAQNALRYVKEAAEQLEFSGSHMNDMVQAIIEISDHSKEIEKIIVVIQDIAYRTNLLALNASIEAARAGEHGKGFAVIADQVRELATKSAEAAKDTDKMIKQSITSVECGTQIANDTAASLNIVNEKAGHVMGAVEQICASSTKQRSEIENISEGTAQISEVIQSNTSVVEESMAVSEELASQAESLQSLTAQFIMNKKLTEL